MTHTTERDALLADLRHYAALYTLDDPDDVTDAAVLREAIARWGRCPDRWPADAVEWAIERALVTECPTCRRDVVDGEACERCAESAQEPAMPFGIRACGDCGSCHGSGRVLNFADRLVECSSCDGLGVARVSAGKVGAA